MYANQFDAIVIGSGITGGWAAKELTEQGLKVLMLERGRKLEHGKDYVTEHRPEWTYRFRNKPLRELYDSDYRVHKQLYAFSEKTRHFFNNDRENPYSYKPGDFLWFRGGTLGGRSLTWGRQVYRWSDLDFEANKRDGYGVDWPIRYRDIEPWYDHVERFIGVSGEPLGLSHLPDSQFLPPMELNIVEKDFRASLNANYSDRVVTIGRTAVLTQPHLGRAACHYCGPCERGCSAGAYFSSLSSTLPAAQATGNLTIMTDMVVSSIDYDPTTRRASGVNAINTKTKLGSRYTAKVIFLCGSTVGSTQILMNSQSASFPNGLANGSGVLGHYLMDHRLAQGAAGIMTTHQDKVTYGRRPNGIYIPRFRNVKNQEDTLNFTRGYGYQGGAIRMGWDTLAKRMPGFGAEFKHQLRSPGPWILHLNGFGECLPYKTNRMELMHTQPDPYGIPQIKFHFSWGNNEEAMGEDIIAQATDMLKTAGAQYTIPFNKDAVGGEGIHEMGTARMGRDPQTSVLNQWNQAHEVPNVFVTDGACMTSSSCVNPSLTYMALTARAANYAAKLLKTGQL